MSASKGDIGSDLAKVDAYENAVADFEELPELTDADFARGVVHVGGRPARGRPPTRSAAKKQVTLRLDPDAVAKFKATGAGWQSRIDAVVVNAAKRLVAHVEAKQTGATVKNQPAAKSGTAGQAARKTNRTKLDT